MITVEPIKRDNQTSYHIIIEGELSKEELEIVNKCKQLAPNFETWEINKDNTEKQLTIEDALKDMDKPKTTVNIKSSENKNTNSKWQINRVSASIPNEVKEEVSKELAEDKLEVINADDIVNNFVDDEFSKCMNPPTTASDKSFTVYKEDGTLETDRQKIIDTIVDCPFTTDDEKRKECLEYDYDFDKKEFLIELPPTPKKKYNWKNLQKG